MRFSVLGSGSEGNSVFIANEDGGVLIDVGFSLKRISERMEMMKITPELIRGLLITHEHIDHIRGIGLFARKYRIPVYGTEETLNRGHRILGNLPEAKIITNYQAFQIGSLIFRAFSIVHDAADPVGYIVESNDRRIGICTDTGCVTHLIKERLKDCDGLILEMNHDMGMLLAGPYPWHLKQRIKSRTGHLSNEDAGVLLHDIWHSQLQTVHLAHLSKENNLPELAMLAASEAMTRAGNTGSTILQVAKQDEPTQMIHFQIRQS